MDIATLQRRLRDFAAARDWQAFHTPKNLAMALMVEAAELLELFQWLTVTESRAYAREPANKERVADEVADVLLYLLQLADHTGVDVAQAVERKLLKNAEKYPAKHPPPAAVSVPKPEVTKVHVLVDWENVQPGGEALRQLVPEGTDVWLFHGPQQKVDADSHRQVFGDDRVVLVPRSGTGKNALDFHLTYYAGYLCARKPPEAIVVVSKDHGYDPMLEHARTLGFDARRCEIVKPSGSPPKVAAGQHPVVACMVHGKAQAEEVKVLADRLAALVPARRPVRKDMLIGLIQSHFHEIGAPSSRTSHALSVLQAQRHVALKGDTVSYPLLAAEVKADVPTKTPAKKAPAKKAPATKPSQAPMVPTKTAKPATAAQIAQRVLVSLKKMLKNKPTSRVGLLKFIETHATKAADPKAMAQQVCVLLEARKAVMLGPNGRSVSYSGERSPSAAAG